MLALETKRFYGITIGSLDNRITEKKIKKSKHQKGESSAGVHMRDEAISQPDLGHFISTQGVRDDPNNFQAMKEYQIA